MFSFVLSFLVTSQITLGGEQLRRDYTEIMCVHNDIIYVSTDEDQVLVYNTVTMDGHYSNMTARQVGDLWSTQESLFSLKNGDLREFDADLSEQILSIEVPGIIGVLGEHAPEVITMCVDGIYKVNTTTKAITKLSSLSNVRRVVRANSSAYAFSADSTLIRIDLTTYETNQIGKLSVRVDDNSLIAASDSYLAVSNVKDEEWVSEYWDIQLESRMMVPEEMLEFIPELLIDSILYLNPMEAIGHSVSVVNLREHEVSMQLVDRLLYNDIAAVDARVMLVGSMGVIDELDNKLRVFKHASRMNGAVFMAYSSETEIGFADFLFGGTMTRTQNDGVTWQPVNFIDSNVEPFNGHVLGVRDLGLDTSYLLLKEGILSVDANWKAVDLVRNPDHVFVSFVPNEAGQETVLGQMEDGTYFVSLVSNFKDVTEPTVIELLPEEEAMFATHDASGFHVYTRGKTQDNIPARKLTIRDGVVVESLDFAPGKWIDFGDATDSTYWFEVADNDTSELFYYKRTGELELYHKSVNDFDAYNVVLKYGNKWLFSNMSRRMILHDPLTGTDNSVETEGISDLGLAAYISPGKYLMVSTHGMFRVELDELVEVVSDLQGESGYTPGIALDQVWFEGAESIVMDLSHKQSFEVSEVQVFNLQGKQLHSWPYSQNILASYGSRLRVYRPTIPQGLYILHVVGKSGNSIQVPLFVEN